MFFGHHNKKITLILDIGDGSVGAALVLLSKNDKPHIIFSSREPVLFEEKPDAKKLQTKALQILDHLIGQVLLQGFADPLFKKTAKKIHTVLCTLSSPWYSSKGKTVIVSQEKKFVISQKFLSSILSKELKTFQDEIQESRKTRLIENNFLAVQVNGYLLEHPVGQNAEHVQASIYMSEAEEVFVQGITDIVSKHTHSAIKDILFHSFPLVVFSVIRDLFPQQLEYLHFDIAGEITDITWVSGGMIQKTVSFPSGKNLITRRIAKSLDVPHEIARSFFHLHMNKHTDTAVEKTITTCIDEALNEWDVYLNDALATLSAEVSLPRKIFMTAHPHTYEIFSDFLKVQKSNETTLWHKEIEITHLGPDLLSHFLILNPTQKFEDFLGLESLFLSRFV